MIAFRLGMLMMIAGSLLIPFGDALAKYAHTHYAIPISFMAWSRFFLGAVLVAPIALMHGVRLKDLTPMPVLFRGVLISFTVLFILQGAARTDLASAYGAFFIAPIVSFILAVIILKETAGLTRWALMIIGLIGVMLVAKPSLTMSSGILFALLAGVFYGSFLATNRALAQRFDPFAMLWAQLIVGGAILIPFASLTDNSQFTTGAIACVILSAGTSALANLLMVFAYMRAEATRLAPLIYTQLIAATAYGVIFFGSVPDPITFAGLALLFLSGAAGLVLRLR